MSSKVNIVNRKAKFNYELLSKYIAGIVLTGSEIKSIRQNKASISESFCKFDDKGELYVLNMTIEKYSFSNTDDNNLRKQRKLLLNKNELKKLLKETINSSNTIIPLKLFINERGLAKIEISLAKGKKLYDKRETIKDRDNKKDLDRLKKIKNQK
jgi:SsrA-binding protein